MEQLPKVYQVNKDVYIQLASCYIRLEEFHEAVLFLNIILGIEPDCVKALFLRAIAYEDMKKPERALEDYTRAHELSPADQTIKNYLLRCRQTVGGLILSTKSTARHNSRSTLDSELDMEKFKFQNSSPLPKQVE